MSIEERLRALDTITLDAGAHSDPTNLSTNTEPIAHGVGEVVQDRGAVMTPTDQANTVRKHRSSADYIDRTIATVRNHRGAENCWPQWANIFADEIEDLRADVAALLAQAETAAENETAWAKTAQGQRKRAEAAEADRDAAVRAAEHCPLCTHAWRRHDPEDGKCDAGSHDLGECPCGRDPSFHRVRNAAIARAALTGHAPDPCWGPERMRHDPEQT